MIRNWLFWTVVLLSGATAVFLLWLGFLVYRGEATLLITFLFTLISTATSTVASVLIRWSAEESAKRSLRELFRSAFRGHVGLLKGMIRLQNQLNDSLREPDGASRENIRLANILLTEQLARASENEQDWRQVLPDEIANSEKQRLEDLNNINQAIVELKPFESVDPEVGKRVKSLETQKQLLVYSPLLVGAGTPRNLLIAGAYEEASEAYSRLIEQQPESHTLYLGRARARYLTGDKEGAWKDVEKAKAMQPENPAVKRFEEALKKGTLTEIPFEPGPMAYAQEAVAAGNRRLQDGDWQTALKEYERAEQLGLLPVFCEHNKAMAYLCNGDTQSGNAVLDKVDRSRLGPYVKVEHSALLTLAGTGQNDTTRELGLVDARRNAGDFDLQKSPLRYLESGLAKTRRLDQPAMKVFALLRYGPS